jgi:hypothetical protein
MYIIIKSNFMSLDAGDITLNSALFAHFIVFKSTDTIFKFLYRYIVISLL